jgi:O-antigen/teichoic acid export membrane protein
LPRARGGFLSHVLTLFSGTVAAQIINIGATLFLARLFSPDDFGLLALFVTVVSLLSVAGGGRYELGIMLPERDDEAANVLVLSMLVLAGLACVAGVLLIAFHSSITQHLGNRIGDWLWAVPFVVFVIGFYQVLGFWCGRMKQFQRLAISRVGQAIVTVAAQLLLFVVHASGEFALIGGYILGQALAIILLLFQVLRDDGRFLLRAYNWQTVRASLKKYRNFPLYKAPYSLVSNAASQLVFVVLQLFSNLSAVGFFSLANRAVYLPARLTSSSMNQVFYEKAATELKHGRLEPFVTRALRIQVLLATPLLVLVAWNAERLFRLLLGPQWAPAGIYAAMLAFPAYLGFLTAWLDRIFDVQGRQRLSLVLAAIGNGAPLAGLYAVLWYARDTVAAVGVYSALAALFSVIWLAFVYHVAQFSLRGLRLLVQDAAFSSAIGIAIVGGMRALFPPWPAFCTAAAAIFLLEAIMFRKYVQRGNTFSLGTEHNSLRHQSLFSLLSLRRE